MIRQVLDEMRRGTTTVGELGRRLGIERSALERMLRFMVRKGLIRQVHAEGGAEACRGCPYCGRCEERPVVGYQMTTTAGPSGGAVETRG
jgi:hypothetical protein